MNINLFTQAHKFSLYTTSLSKYKYSEARAFSYVCVNNTAYPIKNASRNSKAKQKRTFIDLQISIIVVNIETNRQQLICNWWLQASTINPMWYEEINKHTKKQTTKQKV